MKASDEEAQLTASRFLAMLPNHVTNRKKKKKNLFTCLNLFFTDSKYHMDIKTSLTQQSKGQKPTHTKAKKSSPGVS